jgi:hypothetical protein
LLTIQKKQAKFEFAFRQEKALVESGLKTRVRSAVAVNKSLCL